MSSSAENLVYDNSGRIVAADGQLRAVGHVRADGGEANVLVHGIAVDGLCAAADLHAVPVHPLPDGNILGGFPGEFQVSVTYEFTEDNTLQIYYSGISDKATLANMTNHSYFNLTGEGSGKVLDTYLTIHARDYNPVDEFSIPTGEYAAVEGTPMDFNKAKKIGQEIEADFQQLKYTGGYDHNYVTDNYAKGSRRTVAVAYNETSGITMDVISDCPCVQFYAGNFVIDEKGKNGHVYNKREGFCLETQVEPNAVNVEAFHSPVLEAGEKYQSFTAYKFDVRK